MSLMNDMLRDLEKRQAPDRTQQVEAQGYGALTQKTDTHSSRAVILLLGIIITLLLALSIGWWYLQTTSTKGNRAEHVNEVSSSNAINASVMTLEPAKLDHIAADNINTRPQPHSIQPSGKNEQVTIAPTLAASAVEVAPVASDSITSEVPRAPEKRIANSAISIKQKTPVVAAQSTKTEEVKAQTVSVKEDVSSVVTSPEIAKAPVKQVNENKPKPEIEALSRVLVVSAEQRDENAAGSADELIAAGDRERAKTQLKAFIEAYEVDVNSRASLVTLLMQDGNMAGANALLTEEKLLQSSHLRRLKAHWLAQSGQPGDAIALLNSARPDITADPEYHVLLAALYQQQGFSSEAVAAYAELLSYDPKVADWWVGMAIALDSSQQYPSAKKAYQKALQMEGLKFELADFAKQRLATLGG